VTAAIGGLVPDSGFGALYQNYENLGIKKAASADAEAAEALISVIRSCK